jgi:uncharacterized protein (TIGR02246 family)
VKPEEVLEAYAAAVRAKDVEAFLALYSDDVRTFDLWSVWTYDGKPALRGMVEDWFGSPQTSPQVAVEFDDVRVETGDDVAALSAFLTFRGLDADGVEERSMNNRLTWILRRDDDGWKIVHEHTSAPAGDEGKVSLKRAG